MRFWIVGVVLTITACGDPTGACQLRSVSLPDRCIEDLTETECMSEDTAAYNPTWYCDAKCDEIGKIRITIFGSDC